MDHITMDHGIIVKSIQTAPDHGMKKKSSTYRPSAGDTVHVYSVDKPDYWGLLRVVVPSFCKWRKLKQFSGADKTDQA